MFGRYKRGESREGAPQSNCSQAPEIPGRVNSSSLLFSNWSLIMALPKHNPEPDMPRVLVVDDDNDIRYAIARILRQCGCEVTEANSVDSAITSLGTQPFEVVFCDVRFQAGRSGEECLKIVVEQYPQTVMVMMSCAMPGNVKLELKQKGAFECLQKPIFKDTFLRVLQKIDESHDPLLEQAA